MTLVDQSIQYLQNMQYSHFFFIILAGSMIKSNSEGGFV